MTRADILRRLGEAAANALACDGQPRVSHPEIAEDCPSCLASSVAAALTALRAIAREPGGAEAIAAALGLAVAVTPSVVCVSRGACYCAGRIVAAEEKTP